MIALVVILAAALGAAVTVIVILLFLGSRIARRSAGEVDQQMTEARVEIFRDLQQLIGPPDSSATPGGEPPPQRSAVNGHETPPPAPAQHLPGWILTKKGMHLLKGGVVALALGFGHFINEHRRRVAEVAVGAAVAGGTVTMLTLTPWTSDTRQEPPSSAPTVTHPPGPAQPPPGTRQPQPTPTATMPPGESPSPSASESAASPSASLSPTGSATATPTPSATVVPISEESTSPGPSGTPDDGPPPGDGGTVPDGGGDTTAPPDGEPPASEPPPPTTSPPPSQAPADDVLCVGVTVAPLLDADACLLGGG